MKRNNIITIALIRNKSSGIPLEGVVRVLESLLVTILALVADLGQYLWEGERWNQNNYNK